MTECKSEKEQFFIEDRQRVEAELADLVKNFHSRQSGPQQTGYPADIGSRCLSAEESR